MGLRMPDLHAPTVGSGPTSQPTAGAREQLTLPQLIAKKENLEAELHALGSVLDS
ncbi:putative 26S proteasome regulatory subunit, partial [Friedmanniomyces endolithicus]